MFYHETMGTMADESKLYKTFSFRVQDSTSGKKLVRLGVYPVHTKTRKSFGEMTRKLSVTASQ
jgi:hypothetical protein